MYMPPTEETMKQVKKVIQLAEQTSKGQQQTNLSPHSKAHMMLMAELWVRMEDLFPNQWTVYNGLAKLDNSRFDTWCNKLASLSKYDFGVAFKSLEDWVIEEKRADRKAFPPSYAEFLAHSMPSNGHVSIREDNWTAIPKLEDRSEANISAGKSALSGMLADF